MQARTTALGLGICGAVAASTLAVQAPAIAERATVHASTVSTVPTYTHRDTGRTLRLQVGDRLRVRLGTVTDGDFFWHYLHRPDRTIVKIVRKRIIPPKLPAGSVGGEAHTVYTLKAVGTGRTRLRLAYYQGTRRHHVAKRFVLTFRVH